MDIYDEVFADQFKSEACQKDFKDMKLSTEEITELVKDRHPVCENRKTQSGWDIGLFAPSDIVMKKEGKKIYCYAPGDTFYDFDTRKHTNPFTGKEMEAEKAQEIYRKINKRAPLLFEYVHHGCPFFRSSDPLIKYVILSARGDYVENGDTAETDPRIIYRGTLKSDWEKLGDEYAKYGMYDKNLFEKLEPIYDPGELIKEQLKDIPRDKVIPSTGHYSLDVKKDADLDRYFVKPKYTGLSLHGALKTYMSNPDFYIPTGVADKIQKLGIHLNTPVQVYRGLSYVKPKKLGVEELKLGEIVTLKDKYPSSWTTDLCVAAGFASTGIVLSYLAPPDEVVIDTRLLEPDILKDLYKSIQLEVILVKKERKVKVELLMRSDAILKTSK
jgi:hypothetical protein